MKRIILFLSVVSIALVLLMFPFIRVYSVPAYPYPITVTQPDGTPITLKLHGDEFFSYETTEDGYLIAKNTLNYYVYATVDQQGTITASSVIAKDVDKRVNEDRIFLSSVSQQSDFEKLSAAQKNISQQRTSLLKSNRNATAQKAYPLTGSPRALVILVNFTDKSFSFGTPQQDFHNLLNQKNYSTNGGTGSARDYFIASSYGKFSPVFDVVGPFDLPNNMKYYGEKTADDEDRAVPEMIIDACKLASENGVNFADYDTDNDGYVDNVFVYYAGYNQAEWGGDDTVWPHRWSIYPGYNFDGTVADTRFNGKRVFDYACSSELRSYTGTNMCGIGTFCHEFGHVIGLPDYYDTSGNGRTTLGSWSIMDVGSYNNNGRTPPTYSIYDRFYLGYTTPEELNSPADVILSPIYQATDPLDDTSNQGYLLSTTNHNLNGASPSPNEFFIVEYRKKTGWDSYLPSEGMLIWHIDYNATKWNNNTPNNYTSSPQTANDHMSVYIETSPGTVFTSGSFTPKLWSGTDINRPITDIALNNDRISFKIMGGAPAEAIVTENLHQFSTSLNVPSASQSINIKGNYITNKFNCSVPSASPFEIKLSTDSEWSKNVEITPVNNEINVDMQIRYNPSDTQNHNAYQLHISSDEINDIYINLSGRVIGGKPSNPEIRAGVVYDLIEFTDVKINSKKQKVLNIKTTDVNGSLKITITGTDAAMFKVSYDVISQEDANSETGINITLDYNPTTEGPHNAVMTISEGGLPEDKVINLKGN